MLANSQTLPQSSERTCDAEPIHIPGSIQPHGLLFLFEVESGNLVHWAGDVHRLLNVTPISGLSAHALFGTSLPDLLGTCLLKLGDEPVHVGCVRPQERPVLAMMAHRTGNFVAIELLESGEENTAASALYRVGKISHEITTSQSLAQASQAAAEQVRSIVGFDSVMVYRFLDDGCGSVIAQSRAVHAAVYLGHRFPESDIPRQARELYRRNLIRVVSDVAFRPAAIEPPPNGQPIDMSHCILRSVSPVHIQYLKNMGVGASMSVSLLVEGELWGLIACHHYGPRPVSLEAQLLSRHVGISLSTFIRGFRQAEIARLGAHQSDTLESVLRSLRSSSDPERRLRTSGEELKRLIDCGGFVLLSEGELVAGAGQFPDAARLRDLSSLVEAQLQGRQSYANDGLGQPPAALPANSIHASGVLAVRLEAWRPLLALWLRPEQVEEIDWAGEPTASGSSKPLSPRQSFAKWREIVRGRSRPWLPREIEAAELFKTRVGFAMQRHRLKELNGELNQANALLNKLATTDPLTGLANRRLFEKCLRGEWERALRQSGSLALIAIDVDHFKKYNDSFGHPAGDECLKLVANAIGEACRSIDVAARLGGEEFALLLPGIDVRGAASVAERVRARIEGLGLHHPHPEAGVVTISLGVVAAPPFVSGGTSLLLSAADRALYRAKADGRNRVAVGD